MPERLLDINLQQVPDSYLAGAWRVAERMLNRADPDTALAQAVALYLQADELRVETATEQAAGAWAVQRDPLLSRPYLNLQVAQESTTALITRLRRSPDGAHLALTLYFHSGMELHLVQP